MAQKKTMQNKGFNAELEIILQSLKIKGLEDGLDYLETRIDELGRLANVLTWSFVIGCVSLLVLTLVA